VSLGWPVVFAVLVGALLHASWNALIKAGPDKSLDTALMNATGPVIGFPLLLWTGLPPMAAWPYLAASIAVHLGYYMSLAGAYKHGDLGQTYPIMRGVAPLWVAMSSSALIGEPLGVAAWVGVAAICGGVLLVGLSRRAEADALNKRALVFALVNAAIVATYTIIDGLGSRTAGNPLSYAAMLFTFNGIPNFVRVMWRRRGRMADTLAYARTRWPLALAGTAASFASYAIALWAMSQAPVAAVAALRETSVLFAVLIGGHWLKEGFGARRLAGAALILFGVVSLRLL
jgi:drug/metabolite transporter (DMT)-like permease